MPFNAMVSISIVLGIGVVCVPLFWACRTFRCPVWKKKVRRSALTIDHVACPHCDWQAVRSVDADLSIQSIASKRGRECLRCGCSSGHVELWRLWDGGDYCSVCLKTNTTTLYQAVRSGQTLNETMPFSTRRVASRVFLILWVGMAATFGTIAFSIGFEKGG